MSVTVPPEVVEAGVGAGVVLMRMPASTGSPASYSFYDVQRGRPLLVFAYAGVALPVLLLIELYGQPLASVLTSPDIAEELVRTMASAIGLVLAVPLTTALAVAVATADRRSPRIPRPGKGEVVAAP